MIDTEDSGRISWMPVDSDGFLRIITDFYGFSLTANPGFTGGRRIITDFYGFWRILQTQGLREADIFLRIFTDFGGFCKPANPGFAEGIAE